MFDLHVHTAPDITSRIGDDHDVVAAYERARFTGCVLKGHYESTVGRAAAAGRGRNLRVYGGIVLNQHAGGINPAAVAACLDSGGRVVWMPTADAHTQRAAGLPSLCAARGSLSGHSYAIPPVDWSVAEDVRRICSMVAEADAVLATGHLGPCEVRWLSAVAAQEGVRRLLLTHPSYTVPGMSAAEVSALTAGGVFAEITTFQLLHQPGCTAKRLARFACDVGLDHVILSSDAGQPDSPNPPDAIELLIDLLAWEGLDRDALRACAAERPSQLVTP